MFSKSENKRPEPATQKQDDKGYELLTSCHFLPGQHLSSSPGGRFPDQEEFSSPFINVLFSILASAFKFRTSICWFHMFADAPAPNRKQRSQNRTAGNRESPSLDPPKPSPTEEELIPHAERLFNTANARTTIMHQYQNVQHTQAFLVGDGIL